MFTIEVRAGVCNVLKSFITALSIGPTNIRPRKDLHHPADYSEVLDDIHISHGSHEYWQPFASCRFLILAEEDSDQQHLDNDFNRTYIRDIHEFNPKLTHLFADKAIDWFYDRTLICEKVFNRIMNGIDKIIWKPIVLSEVDRVTSSFIHPVLSINIRTWTHAYDPPNLSSLTSEPGKRQYNFDVYKAAIEQFLPDCKSIFLSIDNETKLAPYIELLKDYKVITYINPSNISYLQYSVSSMLISSKCDFLVCNRLSTFSECIWWFSRCKQKVIPLF